MESQRNYLYSLIKEFVQETGSQWGQAILDDFIRYAHKFWLVKPKAVDLALLLDVLREPA